MIQPSVPIPIVPPIDWAHLDRATMGDRRLADEVLELFVAQAADLTESFRGSPENQRFLLHKLKGAARGIGAWPVADAAASVEAALAASGDPDPALSALLARIDAARAVIAIRLRGV